MKLQRGLSLGLLTMLASSQALAADVKRECVEASTEGQLKRDAGELLSARDRFLVCSRDACPAVVRSSCSGWLTEVEQQIPSVVVRAADASNADITDGSATIDGIEHPLDGKPIPLDPGKHVVVVDTQDGVHLEKKLLLAAGEKSRLIELRITPAASAEPVSTPSQPPPAAPGSSGIPTGAWILGGVSVVALGSFGVFALSAKKELDQLEEKCAPSCEDSQSDTGRTNALIADISLGVGVVALAGAVTWALLGGSSEPAASERSARLSVSPAPHGGYATLSGRF
jgi:hypothetical protein